MKLLEENPEKNLHDLRFGDSTLDITPKAQTVEKKMLISWTLLKLKTCSVKVTVKIDTHTLEENISKYIQDNIPNV